MNKRAIAILGAIFILIVGTLGVLIYLRTKSTPEQVQPPIIVDEPTEETPTEEPVEETPTDRAVRLTDDTVVSPILTYQGTGISYLNRVGELYQTSYEISGNTVLLSNKRQLPLAAKSGISKVFWPQAGNNFIVKMDGGTRPMWSLYDTNKAAYVDLPPQVYSFDWMPTGDKIMYVWLDEAGKATLNISNPDTTGYQVLTDFYEPDNVISVSPDGANVLFHRMQTQDQTKNPINLVTTDGKTFRSIIKDGYNKGVKWSPDSQKFLFTKRDPATQKFTLWVAYISTGEVRNLGFTTTVEKAAWAKDSQTVYVSAPIKGTAGEGLTEDSLYSITVTTLLRQEYAPGIAVDGQDLFLSPNEDVLFFRNAQDNALYYIKLK